MVDLPEEGLQRFDAILPEEVLEELHGAPARKQLMSNIPIMRRNVK